MKIFDCFTYFDEDLILDLRFNIHNNYVLIFLHNTNYNEHKIYIATQVIDVLFPIIQQQANIEHESITSEQLNQINKEFQELISKKKLIIEQIQQNTKNVIRDISNLDLPTMSSILTSKFSQYDQLTYICNICNNFSGKNSKALSAHQRGCKKNHEGGNRIMDIKLITRSDCTYCVMAKKLLVEHNIPYKEAIIGVDIDREDVLELLLSRPNLSNILPIARIKNGDKELWFNYTGLLDYINK